MFLANRIFFESEASGFQPLVDLYETEDSLVVEIDIPGVNSEDVLIKTCDDVLVVEGVRRESFGEKRLKYICMERSLESFRRIIRLPVPVNCMSGRASYNEGVLTITFPKIRDKVFKIKIEK